MRLKLPLENRNDIGDQGLAFDFLADLEGSFQQQKQDTEDRQKKGRGPAEAGSLTIIRRRRQKSAARCQIPALANRSAGKSSYCVSSGVQVN
jgi:hypothetical protein